jgi:hypothetical protein
MTLKTPRPPPRVRGAVAVGEVSQKRCGSSPTKPHSIVQPPKCKGGGPHRHPSKSDGPSPRDAAGPYSATRLRDMEDQRFRAAMARAEKVRS